MATQLYLIDQISRRAIEIERLANGQARQAVRFLPGLLLRIEELFADTPTPQLAAVGAQVEAVINEAFAVEAARVVDELQTFGAIEAAFTQQLLANATSLPFDNIRPAPSRILSTFTNRPMVFSAQPRARPLTIEQMFNNLGGDAGRRALQVFRDAQITGSTAQEITRDIRSVVGQVKRRDIVTEVLTAHNHVAVQARSAVYDQNQDVIEAERLVAVLDENTSVTCAKLDYTEYPVGEGLYPPFHRRCRTQRVPIIREQFRIPVVGRTRASSKGPVSAQLTYDGFLRMQDEDFQNRILGPQKARLFRAGLSIDRFADESGVVYNLDQLRALNPRAYNEVFGDNN